PTMRAIELPGISKASLSDTVGFISDLPTQLVAAFRATLEEVVVADLILHVRDMANPDNAAQKSQVLDVLGELGIDSEARSILEVWNKWDLLDDDRRAEMEAIAAANGMAVPVSAETGHGIACLMERIAALLTQQARAHEFLIPASDGQRLAWLHSHGEVMSDVDAGEG